MDFEKIQKYLEEHKITEVFEALTKQVIMEKPENLIDFVIEKLEDIIKTGETPKTDNLNCEKDISETKWTNDELLPCEQPERMKSSTTLTPDEELLFQKVRDGTLNCDGRNNDVENFLLSRRDDHTFFSHDTYVCKSYLRFFELFNSEIRFSDEDYELTKLPEGTSYKDCKTSELMDQYKSEEVDPFLWEIIDSYCSNMYHQNKYMKLRKTKQFINQLSPLFSHDDEFTPCKLFEIFNFGLYTPVESSTIEPGRYDPKNKKISKQGLFKVLYPCGSEFLGLFKDNQKNGFGIQISIDKETVRSDAVKYSSLESSSEEELGNREKDRKYITRRYSSNYKYRSHKLYKFVKKLKVHKLRGVYLGIFENHFYSKKFYFYNPGYYTAEGILSNNKNNRLFRRISPGEMYKGKIKMNYPNGSYFYGKPYDGNLVGVYYDSESKKYLRGRFKFGYSFCDLSKPFSEEEYFSIFEKTNHQPRKEKEEKEGLSKIWRKKRKYIEIEYICRNGPNRFGPSNRIKFDDETFMIYDYFHTLSTGEFQFQYSPNEKGRRLRIRNIIGGDFGEDDDDIFVVDDDDDDILSQQMLERIQKHPQLSSDYLHLFLSKPNSEDDRRVNSWQKPKNQDLQVLFFQIRLQNYEIVEYLIKNLRLLETFRLSRENIFKIPVLLNDTRMVRLLLKRGVDMNSTWDTKRRNVLGEISLYEEVYKSVLCKLVEDDNHEMVDIFLEHSSSSRTDNREKNLDIHFGEIVSRFKIEYNNDFGNHYYQRNRQTKQIEVKRSYISPIMKSRSFEMFQKLYENGADVTHITKPEDQFVYFSEFFDDHEKLKIMKTLEAVKRGWDPKTHNFFPKYFRKIVWQLLHLPIPVEIIRAILSFVPLFECVGVHSTNYVCYLDRIKNQSLEKEEEGGREEGEEEYDDDEAERIELEEYEREDKRISFHSYSFNKYNDGTSRREFQTYEKDVKPRVIYVKDEDIDWSRYGQRRRRADVESSGESEYYTEGEEEEEGYYTEEEGSVYSGYSDSEEKREIIEEDEDVV